MPAPRPEGLVDVVDAADRPIGQVTRTQVLDVAAGFRVVHIFVFHPETGHLLLQRLGETRERNPLRWGSSVAGYLHAGEDYLEAAERRAREELGLETPLAKHGETWMRDGRGRKFISLYTTAADRVEIREPDHIAETRFLAVGSIAEQLSDQPETFTETFRYLFPYFLTTTSLQSLSQ